ncbi:hypothetical protein DCW30_05680 [Streptomyces alfalfae]|uniref:Uncharacterized protein n=1 Tax=Streptomyces alfalfae TaxID=1642299 RepID=A0ABN4VNV8_9ACTN|nr:hypothetical protein [Streptomyces alfalfae]APY88209.1 hypothetical protein A7J05_23195 [Streptomyces alfalfae]AYA18604.1 hypothetical protein D3X13_22305 [Streptomyces fradiae]RXX46516.1 hypothetical protein DCW30_05680 [Streptomyces alfalfae]RZM90029.1 hypothetical protein D4104_25615 [Streptomyces alfalfae]
MAARPRDSAPSPARRCPACRAPTLRQLVGNRAALTVTADLTPLTPEQQNAVREPNRLIWCLRTNQLGIRRLVWLDAWHPPDCPHDHVTDHICPPDPTTLF